MDFEGAWNDAVTMVVTIIPKLIVFLLILIVGWAVAKLLARATNAVLERVGFDRAVERGGIARALEPSRYDASDLLAKVVYYAVLLITLTMAFNVFGPNPVSDLLAALVAWLPRLFVAIVIVVVAAFLASMVRDVTEGALGGLSYGRVLARVAQAFVIGLGIIAALNQIEVATSITMPILIFFLATIGGILVVGLGGGMVRPMQGRWESWLNRAEIETRQATTDGGRPTPAEQSARAAAEARLAAARTSHGNGRGRE